MTTEARRYPAPAKINLTLHVTGQRDDGYHLLDSLVMFTALGDEIAVSAAETLSLDISGPFANGLRVADDNLVLRAARLFDVKKGADIHLTKNLPLASGIGGGSADAAATLFALSDLWNTPLPPWEKIMSLGADVGVCMSSELTRMAGIGDEVALIGPTPPLHVLLVNPGVEVPTPQVFKALPNKQNPPMPDDMPNPWGDAWLGWVKAQRNDLQAPALNIAPVIATALDEIAAQHGCQLARMSGSGATCFGLFDSKAACKAAKTALASAHPDWWIQQTTEITI